LKRQSLKSNKGYDRDEEQRW